MFFFGLSSCSLRYRELEINLVGVLFDCMSLYQSVFVGGKRDITCSSIEYTTQTLLSDRLVGRKNESTKNLLVCIPPFCSSQLVFMAFFRI